MEREYIDGAMELISDAQMSIRRAEDVIDNLKEIIADIRSGERFEALSIKVRNDHGIRDYCLSSVSLCLITGEDLLPLIQSKIEKSNKLIQESYEQISNLIK